MEWIMYFIYFQITGGLLWFTFYFANTFTNPNERLKFNKIINSANLNGAARNRRILFLMAYSFVLTLFIWELSAYRTIKKSYKYWVQKG